MTVDYIRVKEITIEIGIIASQSRIMDKMIYNINYTRYNAIKVIPNVKKRGSNVRYSVWVLTFNS